MTDINGAEIEPVDIITFGSPCQDLSVAGKRAGMKHETNGDSETTRSGLFIEAVRIIKEMRRATNDEYPKFAVWENVPGAFSSNKGEDFRTVLEELIKITEPEAPPLPAPENGKWPYADCILGDGWSIAYRTFDAQYWGVPQRRRRIYLVADFTGECAGEILFERESLQGHLAESGAEGQSPAENAQGSAGAADRASTYIIDNIGGQSEYGKESPVNGTLRAGAQGAIAYGIENHPADSRVNIDESGKCQTLTSRMGTGGGNVPMVMESFCKSERANEIIVMATQQGGAEINTEGICPTITAAAGMSGNNQPVCCIDGDKIGKAERAGGSGFGIRPGDSMYTLTAKDVHAVAYGISSYDSNAMKSANPQSGIYEASTSRTLDLNGGNPACNQGGVAIVEECPTYCTTTGSYMHVTEDVTPTLLSRDYKDPNVVAYGLDRASFNQGANAQYSFSILPDQQPTLTAKGPGAVCSRYIVRRLTPTECARLQGFPDTWGHPPHKETLSDEEYSFWLNVRNTHATINGRAAKEYTRAQILTWYNKLHTDSSEYKMWGNGIALPNALYVMQGIAEQLQKTRIEDE